MSNVLTFKPKAKPEPEDNEFLRLVFTSLKSMAPDCKLRELISKQEKNIFSAFTESVRVGIVNMFSAHDYAILEHLKLLGLVECDSTVSADVTSHETSTTFTVRVVDPNRTSKPVLSLSFTYNNEETINVLDETDPNRTPKTYRVKQLIDNTAIPNPVGIKDVLHHMDKQCSLMHAYKLAMVESDEHRTFLYKVERELNDFSIQLQISKEYYYIQDMT